MDKYEQEEALRIAMEATGMTREEILQQKQLHEETLRERSKGHYRQSGQIRTQQ